MVARVLMVLTKNFFFMSILTTFGSCEGVDGKRVTDEKSICHPPPVTLISGGL